MTDLSCDKINDIDFCLQALQWHIDCGADFLFEDESVDRTIVSNVVVVDPVVVHSDINKNDKVIKQPDISSKTYGASIAIEELKVILSDVNDIDALKAAIFDFDGVALKKTAKNMIFACGNQDSKIMFIGDVPSSEDDKNGDAFTGNIGVLEDKIHNSIGLTRDDVYLTNICNWRPPGNRSLSESELEILKLIIVKHIELINPEIIIFLGVVPAKLLLNAKGGMSKLRGQSFNYGDGMKAMVMHHPDSLLKNPMHKRDRWHDMLKLKEMIDC